MNELIRLIFSEHGYTIENYEKAYLAMIEKKEYFLVAEYCESDILNFFNSDRTEALIDRYIKLKDKYQDLKKNTSLIICHKTSDVGLFKEKNRSLVFRIEEDEYYFRKYIILYTENSLKEFIRDESLTAQINKVLQTQERLESFQKDYYADEAYFTAMQLIVKLPFLNFQSSKNNYTTIEHELFKVINEKCLNDFSDKYLTFENLFNSQGSEKYFETLKDSFLSTEDDDELLSDFLKNFEEHLNED